MTNAPLGAANPHVRYADLAGEQVVYIALPDGREVIFSRPTWDDRLRAGYSPFIQLKPNGSGRVYPAAKAYPPSPRSPRTNRDLAREGVALKMLRQERDGRERALAKGWVARTLNGDPLDLRDSNLALSSAKGRRNSHLAVWDARERLKLADQGFQPNAVFAERRKAHRKQSKKGKDLGSHSQTDTADAKPATFPPPPLNPGPAYSGASARGRQH